MWVACGYKQSYGKASVATRQSDFMSRDVTTPTRRKGHAMIYSTPAWKLAVYSCVTLTLLKLLDMGIKGLTALISQHAPNAIKEHEIKTLFGRKVAIDASMSIYQFLIAVRQQDGQMLQNEAGETTSHLMGFFYRTIRIVENGIKPAYVFDGKPPEMKKGVVSNSIVSCWVER